MAKVIVFCEKSGAVRRALRARGIDAWSNDIEPADDDQQFHIRGDAIELHNSTWQTLDGFIAHPECRYLSVSGMHWNSRRPERQHETDKALIFAATFFMSKVKRRIIENPVSILSTKFWGPQQTIQPYQFGHDASKRTCLWLEGVPKLKIDPSLYVAPRLVVDAGGVVRERWTNQTDTGQNRLGPSATRSADRAETYAGIADALADAMALALQNG